MVLLDDFFGGLNIATSILGVVGCVVSFLFYRVIKNGDDKLKEIVSANKQEIERINKHLESTDLEVERLKDQHNSLNIQFIERINTMEKVIISHINTLALQLEQLKK